MMFGRNLRQLLLTSPVRGRTLMGVDPGYKHGCKLAIISPTSKFHFQIFLKGLIKIYSFRGKDVSKPTFFYQIDFFCKAFSDFHASCHANSFLQAQVKFQAPGFHCLLWCYYSSLK